LAGFFTFQLGRLLEVNQASLSGTFFVWHPFIFMIFVPAVGMRLWAEERRLGTRELLFTLPTSIWQAVLGKYLAGAIFMALSLLLTFPTVVSVYYLGKPDGGTILTGYVGSLLLALAFLALSSFTSSLTRNQIVSFIVAMVICLFLIFCGWPAVTEILLSWGVHPTVVRLVENWSVLPHHNTFQRGVIDTRDVLYFLSVIFFGLFGTTAVLKSK